MNLLKTPKSSSPPPRPLASIWRRVSGAAHFRLKGGICIPRERLPLACFMTLASGGARGRAGRGLVSACGLQLEPHPSPRRPAATRPYYLFIITQSNKCAACSVTPHHTSGRSNPGQRVGGGGGGGGGERQGYPVFLFLPFFIFLSAAKNALWQGNNLPAVPALNV